MGNQTGNCPECDGTGVAIRTLGIKCDHCRGTGDAPEPGMWYVSIFVNGCLDDHGAWYDQESGAIEDADYWGDTSIDGHIAVEWLEPYQHNGTTVRKGYYPNSPYMVEITHYPTYAFCECADSQHDMLDFGHGIYDSTYSEECIECEEWGAHSESIWEAGQP